MSLPGSRLARLHVGVGEAPQVGRVEVSHRMSPAFVLPLPAAVLPRRGRPRAYWLLLAGGGISTTSVRSGLRVLRGGRVAVVFFSGSGGAVPNHLLSH
jgi:hypothetical protein